MSVTRARLRDDGIVQIMDDGSEVPLRRNWRLNSTFQR